MKSQCHTVTDCGRLASVCAASEPVEHHWVGRVAVRFCVVVPRRESSSADIQCGSRAKRATNGQTPKFDATVDLAEAVATAGGVERRSLSPMAVGCASHRSAIRPSCLYDGPIRNSFNSLLT